MVVGKSNNFPIIFIHFVNYEVHWRATIALESPTFAHVIVF
jgi:hypothetical protein